MKVIIYTLLEDGTIPSQIIDGGYFPKSNLDDSPRNYDLIGISESWTGKAEITDKTEFDNYINSYLSDDEFPLQPRIDAFWNYAKGL